MSHYIQQEYNNIIYVEFKNVLIEVTFKYLYDVKPLTSDADIPERHEAKSYEAGGSVNGLFLIMYY